MNIFTVIPAFNEVRTINEAVKSVEKYCNKVIIVDDGSDDNTHKAIKSKKVIILRHPVNLGQGAALQTGFEYALGAKADIVVTFDADGQHTASDIPKLIKPVQKNQADVALGSRFLGDTENMPLFRLLTLKFGILFTYLYSGVKLTDTYNGLRALNKKALALIEIKHNDIEHASEILDKIVRHNLKFIEVPTTVKYSKQSLRKGVKNRRSFSIAFNLIWSKIF